MIILKKTERKALQPDCLNRAPSYLGIESGATRTTALLAIRATASLVCARLSSARPTFWLLDDEALVQHFTAINALCRQAAAPLAGIAIGMAGALTDSDRQRIRAAAAKVWPNVPCYATNDLETALAAGGTGAPNKFAAQIPSF